MIRNENKNHNKKALPMWDGWSRSRRGVPVYDTWLDTYQNDLDKAGKILDLGCGIGANTQYLIERGYHVLSADYSREALKSIDVSIPGSETTYVDMNNPLPFPDGSFHTVVADISLHYFDERTTLQIMREIRRILASGGVLLARVSSINDVLYGAGSGREIEERYYDHGSYAQRYMDEEDVKRFFGVIGKPAYREMAMTRQEAYYSQPKMLYEVRVSREEASHD